MFYCLLPPSSFALPPLSFALPPPFSSLASPGLTQAVQRDKGSTKGPAPRPQVFRSEFSSKLSSHVVWSLQPSLSSQLFATQGIDHLDFRPDKFGNQDIVGMVSAQVPNIEYMINCYLTYPHKDEVVTFSTTIYPIDAKGMVEKWLLQVSCPKQV